MANDTTILVIDDDIDALDRVSDALAVPGYAIKRAQTREVAEEILSETRIDLAIVDLRMDRMDAGLVLCYRIKSLFPEAQVILLSAVTAETGLDFRPRGVEERTWVKADLVVHKPIVAERLRSDVRRLLARAARATGNRAPEHIGQG